MTMRAFLRRSDARPRTRTDWLDSRHTFSFGQHHDPAWMGFGALRVINEDRVAGGGGFMPHRHANMEIISIVLDGALAHRDSTGQAGVIHAGDVQWMSAGHGIEHSEFNASDVEPVHFLQIWIQPDRVNAPPGYGQRHIDPANLDVGWQVLAGDDVLPLRQQASLRRRRLPPGASATLSLAPGRCSWLQLIDGTATVGEIELAAGDGLGLMGEGAGVPAEVQVTASRAADLLLLDVPA